MRTQKAQIVFLTIGIVIIGAGLALSYRKSAHNTSANKMERQSILIEDGQALPSQRTRFAETDGLEFERRVVKGAPFSAIVVIEITQTNSNNTADSRKSVSLIYRDAQGRTRRDRMPTETTDITSISERPPLLTTINDPVAGYTYTLENRVNIARRSQFTGQSEQELNSLAILSQSSLSSAQNRGSTQMLSVPPNSNSKQKLSVDIKASPSEATRELLGQREIEGFNAEGTRLTMTIPPGVIGNEQPLLTSVERWYSPELKVVLLIERSDPRFGRITWRLSGIQRGAPAPAQFKVPNGFKIIPN